MQSEMYSSLEKKTGIHCGPGLVSSPVSWRFGEERLGSAPSGRLCCRVCAEPASISQNAFSPFQLSGMGVHGLTTYLSEHSAAIAKTLHFSSDSAPDEPTTFVIDAWS